MSCENEDDIEYSTLQQNYIPNVDFTVKYISTDSIFGIPNVEKLIKKYQIPKTLNRTYSDTNYFDIEYNYVNYLESRDGSYHSYTYYVKNTPSGEGLENILFSYNGQDSYSVYLVHYDLNESEIDSLNNGYSINISERQSVFYELSSDMSIDNDDNIEALAQGCVRIAWATGACAEGNHEGGLLNGEPCPAYNEVWNVEFVGGGCSSGGPSSGTGSGWGNGTSTSTSGNSGWQQGGSTNNPNTNNPNQQVTTVVTVCRGFCLEDVNRELFFDYLNNLSEMDEWEDASIEERDLIDAFLIQELWSQESFAFSLEAIKAWNENPDAEVDFEEEIINELTGKADCIYKKLKQNSTNFSDAINNFDGEFPVSHLNFSINNSLPSGNYGVTNPPNNYMINIEISNTQLSNVSDLGAAIAFVHEVIHAEIFRKMLSAAQTGDLDPGNMTTQQQIDYVNSLRENFPGIYDYYRERYKPTWNHNMMAQHYIEIIADMVEEFDNSSQPRQVYEDISWAGLREIEVLNNSIAWDNLSSTDQSRILNNLSQHFFNGPNNCN